ncbi:MAG: 2-oxo acid dehydrogenase subunit E2 [Gammaproteobacteria bacterium]|uniref:dihydrolipoamide acetyltransferase family protein n=1 Tax=Rhodoferax sp. TaxID=50421 RepID=UPI0017B56DAA|nr:dihydrolipoamide acetyltransferase family protein [Rhodoferax sp.]MBU3898563.1 2-oxo acid dehydrogenase subunit E2 [Gammaproteobacteria bacterium]MBA3059823.1 2-oxo acid dehydrogenase subunit E2 [Rhodoferax sp.]MBU3997890.1 2-oxo acid dehydrogenase subunit E2 [Gammaproteobacteria bacterium]MBU4079338.1 2-oxo acid dehydrogenase subunit E2 [Gammaproteobacteria bacterium]MBU4113199.1 2-oxo acid dehydrogenase subunit E2 [Gammaproteobacteria bacterium]
MIEFKLPSLGADMDEGTLLEWRVKPGDAVKRGQVVAVVDTSKAAVDVEIWHDGVVHELLVAVDEKVPVDTVLATLLAPGEVAPASPASPASRAAATALAQTEPAQASPVAPEPRVIATPAPATGPAPAAPLSPPANKVVAAARHPVSPSARRRALALGIDPDTVRGTGAQGSVTLADVEAATHAAPRPEPAMATVVAAAATPAAAVDRQKAMRQAIAAAMSRSKREIPHYYLSETIPMTRALEWLQKRNEGLPITERILTAAFLLKAVAAALRRTPELNGFYRDGQFEPSTAVHTGVAISLRGGGLVAPAIHDVAAKPLVQLMRELADLVKRARAGSLRSSEMSDPTITITNLGEQSVQSVFGVIYPPQVALVGLGSIDVRPWVEDGQVRALPLLCATLAADHRASDGHRGALFLAELRELLQQPQTLADASNPTASTRGDAT